MSRPSSLRPLLFLTALFLISSGLGAEVVFRVAVPGPYDREYRPLVLALADTVVGFDPVTGMVQAGLASAWTRSDDGRVWSFTLKPARWSDGSALTSSDVAAAWKVRGEGILGLETPDPRHLTVVLSAAPGSVSVFGGPRWALSPRADGTSCGPFLAEPGLPLVLKKNPQYREAAAVKIQRLEFTFAGTPEEAQLRYRNGLADWVPHGGGPGTLVEPGLKDGVTNPGWGTVFLRFNLDSSRLADRAFRQALAATVDLTALAKTLRGPALVPQRTLFPYVPSPVPLVKGRAPVKAKEPAVGAAAPPKPALPLPGLTVLYSTGETNRRVAEAVADQWRRRWAIPVDTKEDSFSRVLAARKSGVWEVVVSGWVGDEPDPASFFGFLRAGAQANGTGFANPGYDALVDQLAAGPSAKDRDRLVAQGLGILADEVPVAPLLSYAWVNQINLKRWSGWSANPTDIHPWTGIGPRK